jgi:hypothetical protein
MRSCRLTSLTIVSLLGLACARGGAAVPTTLPFSAASTRPVQAGEDIISETKRTVAQWQQFPLLPRRPIAHVVHFSEVGGMLAVDWPLLQTGRVPLTDLPGDSLIQCHMSPRLPGRSWPMFEHYEVTEPGPVCRHLQVLSTDQQLQVVQDIETADRLQTVSLIETLERADVEPVTLRIQIIQDDQTTNNLALSAPTLTVLRRQYPREYEQYLRPLFRQFRQDDAVFAVEDKVAWQVMADAWNPPPDLESRLKPLIAQLDATEYSAREHAQTALERIGEPAALFLFAADRRSWTAEQKARTDKLLADFFPLSPEQAKGLGGDVNFLLDCLAGDDPDLCAATLKHLDRVLGRKIDFDCDQPMPGRLASIAQLRRQLTPSATTRDSSK